MALQLKQQLKLTQQLVMTPQLQQAIKLLQLSRLELSELLAKEILENPFLEVVEQEIDSVGSKEKTEKFSVEEKKLFKNAEAEWENYLGQFSSFSKDYKEVDLGEEVFSLENRCASAPDLTSHLLWQLNLSKLTELEKKIGKEIIGNLDSKGYLTISCEELASSLGVSLAQVEKVLRIIQSFDPVGVGARSIQECFLIQLQELGYTDEKLFRFVREHLEDVEKRKIELILKKLEIDKEKLQEYIDILKGLNPFPGSQYANLIANYVVPDVYVFKYEGEFVILLNEDGLPSLQLSPLAEFFLVQNENKVSSSKDKEYLQEKFKDAVWLIKSLHQRQRTLYKVAEAILHLQRDFFEHGISALKPMTLRDVAEYIEMHESTVSRITTNKYMSTPFGLFELKFFFNSGLKTSNGTSVGAESIKAKIKSLIEQEDKSRPLSDEAIAKILKKQLGVNIARRTVAKYRTVMGIPSSAKRKEIFS